MPAARRSCSTCARPRSTRPAMPSSPTTCRGSACSSHRRVCRRARLPHRAGRRRVAGRATMTASWLAQFGRFEVAVARLDDVTATGPDAGCHARRCRSADRRPRPSWHRYRDASRWSTCRPPRHWRGPPRILVGDPLRFDEAMGITGPVVLTSPTVNSPGPLTRTPSATGQEPRCSAAAQHPGRTTGTRSTLGRADPPPSPTRLVQALRRQPRRRSQAYARIPRLGGRVTQADRP